jgi:AmmeMemoRadiSam system protein A
MTLSALHSKYLTTLARNAIEAKLNGQIFSPSIPENFCQESRGVFVTIHNIDGDLRGCMGHISPTCDLLTAELEECALAAAFDDPRFPPLEKEELSKICIEVSLLGDLEDVTDIRELDCKKYGVVVSSGYRRGLLLPDIQGVETVEMQLDIARRKARIIDTEKVKIQRFLVEKVKE